MTHDGYDHLRESADAEAATNGKTYETSAMRRAARAARPAYDVASVVKMTEAERAAIDAIYPPGMPIAISDDGETVIEEIRWDKWVSDELDRRHRDVINTRIAIVAIIGILAGTLIVLAWIARA